jgi:adenylate kinase
MIVVLTGTPGVGKSVLAKRLARSMHARLVDINALVGRKRLWRGVDRYGSRIARLKVLERTLNRMLAKEKNAVVEGHLACELRLRCDAVIVLRLNPKTLERRLRKRHYAEAKLRDNLLAEMLDYCTVKSLQNYKNVYEVIGSAAMRDVLRILSGRGERYRAGWVDWSEALRKTTKRYI